jgi:hypothetical protein
MMGREREIEREGERWFFVVAGAQSKRESE